MRCSMDKKWLYEIVNIIEHHILESEDSILKVAADKFGINARSVQERFKMLQDDETINNYIRERRLTLIYEHKNNTNCSWEEAIERVKCTDTLEPFWSDVRAFNNSFKKVYGATPTQYMNGNQDIPLRKSILYDARDYNETSNFLEFEETSERRQETYSFFQSMYGLNAREMRIAEALYEAGREIHSVCSTIRYYSNNEDIKSYIESDGIELDTFDLMLYFGESFNAIKKVVDLLRTRYNNIFALNRKYIEFVYCAYKQ